jgi:hypothetical protein
MPKPPDKRELEAKLKLVDQCRKGNYPPEAFDWSCATKDLAGIDRKTLAVETSNYLKQNTGKVPDITPAPRADIPFTYRSKIVGADIQAALKSSFVRGLQEWVMKHMPKQRPSGPWN